MRLYLRGAEKNKPQKEGQTSQCHTIILYAKNNKKYPKSIFYWVKYPLKYWADHFVEGVTFIKGLEGNILTH